MQIEEQEKWLYNRKFDSLESILSSFSNIKYKAINWMFVWCESDIRRILKNTPDDCIVSLEYEEQPFFTIKISQTSKDDKRSEVVVLCIPSKINSLFIILNDSKFANFKRLMNRIINHNYPLLSRVFLRDSEIKELFYHVERQENAKIRIYKVLSYSRLSDTTQEKYLRWTRKLYDEVFDELDEYNAWIKRIVFKALIERIEKDTSIPTKLFEGSISRDCSFKVNGDFKKFYEYIIKDSIEMIAKRLGYLEERSESAEKRLPEPIVIRFTDPISKEKGWNEKFLEKLAELKNISITELHTNPYLHISLLDYRDGSSYGLWIVSENEINIIPQVRATVASMTRLLDHIYQKVQEGETTQYAPIEVTEAD